MNKAKPAKVIPNQRTASAFPFSTGQKTTSAMKEVQQLVAHGFPPPKEPQPSPKPHPKPTTSTCLPGQPNVDNEVGDPNDVVETDQMLKAPDLSSEAGVTAASAANCDTETLVCLLECYLSLNPEPSDSEVHWLAKSLGVSKEALEEVMFKMLSDAMGTDDFVDDSAIPESDINVIADLPVDDYSNMSLAAALEKAMTADTVELEGFETDDDDEVIEAGDPPYLDDGKQDNDNVHRSIILDPTNSDERLVNDGEPDPYILDELRKGKSPRSF